jgi:peptidoglycan/LPS O-acetylase OafA/YrhL
MELARPPKSQLPALDFLRSLAVLLVIATHLSAAYLHAGGPSSVFSALPFVRSGWVGVDLFFVLSGFPIGRQLWRELHRSQTINVPAFFLRRGLRIWPLYVFFLVFVLVVLGRGQFPSGKWWSDAVFLTNYVNQGVVMGSWSLCTEEQFYLLAPLLVLLGARYFGAQSVLAYRRYLYGLLVLLPVVRAVRWWTLTGGFFGHDPEAFQVLYQPLHYHADGLIVGLLLANYDVARGANSTRGFWTSGWWLAVAMGCFLVCSSVQREILGFTGIAILFGAAVRFLLSARRRWLGWLDSWVFYVLSRLSFGMYLNHEYLHEPIAALTLKYVPGASLCPSLHTIATVALLVALSAALALVTFCLIECPFLRLREIVLDRKGAMTKTHDAALTQSGSSPLSGPFFGTPAMSPT